MKTDWIKQLRIALGLGLCCALAPAANAQTYYHPGQPNCCPTYPAPSMPGARPSDLPETAPDSGQTQPDSGQTTPDQPTPPTLPDANQPNLNQPAPAFNPGFAGTAAPTSTGGTATPMLGRLDSGNRFNFFDNQSAIPQSRAWFTYMATEGNDNHLRLTQTGEYFQNGGFTIFGYSSFKEMTQDLDKPFDPDILQRHKQNTYRFGVEVALSDELSFVAQGQYVDPHKIQGLDDAWTAPQFMFKQVLLSSPNRDSVVSGTFAFSPEVGIDGQVITMPEAYVYPGMLFYEELSQDLVLQGGVQFGIPVQGDVYTLDWSVSLGYWLYRHESMFFDNPCVKKPWLLGVMPMVEILGKHLLDDGTIRGMAELADDVDTSQGDIFTTPSGFYEPFVEYDEPRDIVDVTIGSQFYLRNNIIFGTAVSFPISGGQVRSTEWMANINYLF